MSSQALTNWRRNRGDGKQGAGRETLRAGLLPHLPAQRLSVPRSRAVRAPGGAALPPHPPAPPGARGASGPARLWPCCATGFREPTYATPPISFLRVRFHPREFAGSQRASADVFWKTIPVYSSESVAFHRELQIRVTAHCTASWRGELAVVLPILQRLRKAHFPAGPCSPPLRELHRPAGLSCVSLLRCNSCVRGSDHLPRGVTTVLRLFCRRWGFRFGLNPEFLCRAFFFVSGQDITGSSSQDTGKLNVF